MTPEQAAELVKQATDATKHAADLLAVAVAVGKLLAFGVGAVLGAVLAAGW